MTVIKDFIPTSDYIIRYVPTETGSISIFTASYAKIDINNINTFSGKINLLRVYKRTLSEENFSLLGDFPVKPYELLLSSSDNIDTKIGFFTQDSTVVSQSWFTASENGQDFSSDNPIITVENDILFNSVGLTPGGTISDPREFRFFPKYTKISSPDNHEFEVQFKCVTTIDSSPWKGPGATVGTSSMDVYVSGSAIFHDIIGDKLGKRIANFTIDGDYRNFGQHTIKFTTDRDGYFSINFVINNGTWHLSEISITPVFDDGFNPNEITIYIPLNNVKRNEISLFRIEFLNSKNEISDTITDTILPIKLKNNPIYIELDDNLVSGSITIGSGLNNTSDGIVLNGGSTTDSASMHFNANNVTINATSDDPTFSGSSHTTLVTEYAIRDYINSNAGLIPSSATSLELIECETFISISFTESLSTGGDQYEIWRKEADSSYYIVGLIKSESISNHMTFIDDQYQISGSILYRIFYLNNGQYSPPLTGSLNTVSGSLTASNFIVESTTETYILKYDIPRDRRLDKIELLYTASDSTGSFTGSLSYTTFYSGTSDHHIYKIPDAELSQYHSFALTTHTKTASILNG